MSSKRLIKTQDKTKGSGKSVTKQKPKLVKEVAALKQPAPIVGTKRQSSNKEEEEKRIREVIEMKGPAEPELKERRGAVQTLPIKFTEQEGRNRREAINFIRDNLANELNITRAFISMADFVNDRVLPASKHIIDTNEIQLQLWSRMKNIERILKVKLDTEQLALSPEYAGPELNLLKSITANNKISPKDMVDYEDNRKGKMAELQRNMHALDLIFKPKATLDLKQWLDSKKDDMQQAQFVDQFEEFMKGRGINNLTPALIGEMNKMLSYDNLDDFSVKSIDDGPFSNQMGQVKKLASDIDSFYNAANTVKKLIIGSSNKPLVQQFKQKNDMIMQREPSKPVSDANVNNLAKYNAMSSVDQFDKEMSNSVRTINQMMMNPIVQEQIQMQLQLDQEQATQQSVVPPVIDNNDDDNQQVLYEDDDMVISRPSAPAVVEQQQQVSEQIESNIEEEIKADNVPIDESMEKQVTGLDVQKEIVKDIDDMLPPPVIPQKQPEVVVKRFNKIQVQRIGDVSIEKIKAAKEEIAASKATVQEQAQRINKVVLNSDAVYGTNMDALRDVTKDIGLASVERQIEGKNKKRFKLYNDVVEAMQKMYKEVDVVEKDDDDNNDEEDKGDDFSYKVEGKNLQEEEKKLQKKEQAEAMKLQKKGTVHTRVQKQFNLSAIEFQNLMKEFEGLYTQGSHTNIMANRLLNPKALENEDDDRVFKDVIYTKDEDLKGDWRDVKDTKLFQWVLKHGDRLKRQYLNDPSISVADNVIPLFVQISKNRAKVYDALAADVRSTFSTAHAIYNQPAGTAGSNLLNEYQKMKNIISENLDVIDHSKSGAGKSFQTLEMRTKMMEMFNRAKALADLDNENLANFYYEMYGQPNFESLGKGRHTKESLEAPEIPKIKLMNKRVLNKYLGNVIPHVYYDDRAEYEKRRHEYWLMEGITKEPTFEEGWRMLYGPLSKFVIALNKNPQTYIARFNRDVYDNEVSSLDQIKNSVNNLFNTYVGGSEMSKIFDDKEVDTFSRKTMYLNNLLRKRGQRLSLKDVQAGVISELCKKLEATMFPNMGNLSQDYTERVYNNQQYYLQELMLTSINDMSNPFLQNNFLGEPVGYQALKQTIKGLYDGLYEMVYSLDLPEMQVERQKHFSNQFFARNFTPVHYEANTVYGMTDQLPNITYMNQFIFFFDKKNTDYFVPSTAIPQEEPDLFATDDHIEYAQQVYGGVVNAIRNAYGIQVAKNKKQSHPMLVNQEKFGDYQESGGSMKSILDNLPGGYDNDMFTKLQALEQNNNNYKALPFPSEDEWRKNTEEIVKEEDYCCVCFSDLNLDGWMQCCGRPMHKSCYQKLQQTLMNSDPTGVLSVTCPYCRFQPAGLVNSRGQSIYVQRMKNNILYDPDAEGQMWRNFLFEYQNQPERAGQPLGYQPYLYNTVFPEEQYANDTAAVMMPYRQKRGMRTNQEVVPDDIREREKAQQQQLQYKRMRSFIETMELIQDDKQMGQQVQKLNKSVIEGQNIDEVGLMSEAFALSLKKYDKVPTVYNRTGQGSLSKKYIDSVSGFAERYIGNMLQAAAHNEYIRRFSNQTVYTQLYSQKQANERQIQQQQQQQVVEEVKQEEGEAAVVEMMDIVENEVQQQQQEDQQQEEQVMVDVEQEQPPVENNPVVVKPVIEEIKQQDVEQAQQVEVVRRSRRLKKNDKEEEKQQQQFDAIAPLANVDQIISDPIVQPDLHIQNVKDVVVQDEYAQQENVLMLAHFAEADDFMQEQFIPSSYIAEKDRQSQVIEIKEAVAVPLSIQQVIAQDDKYEELKQGLLNDNNGNEQVQMMPVQQFEDMFNNRFSNMVTNEEMTDLMEQMSKRLDRIAQQQQRNHEELQMKALQNNIMHKEHQLDQMEKLKKLELETQMDLQKNKLKQDFQLNQQRLKLDERKQDFQETIDQKQQQLDMQELQLQKRDTQQFVQNEFKQYELRKQRDQLQDAIGEMNKLKTKFEALAPIIGDIKEYDVEGAMQQLKTMKKNFDSVVQAQKAREQGVKDAQMFADQFFTVYKYQYAPDWMKDSISVTNFMKMKDAERANFIIRFNADVDEARKKVEKEQMVVKDLMSKVVQVRKDMDSLHTDNSLAVQRLRGLMETSFTRTELANMGLAGLMQTNFDPSYIKEVQKVMTEKAKEITVRENQLKQTQTAVQQLTQLFSDEQQSRMTLDQLVFQMNTMGKQLNAPSGLDLHIPKTPAEMDAILNRQLPKAMRVYTDIIKGYSKSVDDFRTYKQEYGKLFQLLTNAEKEYAQATSEINSNLKQYYRANNLPVRLQLPETPINQYTQQIAPELSKIYLEAQSDLTKYYQTLTETKTQKSAIEQKLSQLVQARVDTEQTVSTINANLNDFYQRNAVPQQQRLVVPLDLTNTLASGNQTVAVLRDIDQRLQANYSNESVIQKAFKDGGENVKRQLEQLVKMKNDTVANIDSLEASYLNSVKVLKLNPQYAVPFQDLKNHLFDGTLLTKLRQRTADVDSILQNEVQTMQLSQQHMQNAKGEFDKHFSVVKSAQEKLQLTKSELTLLENRIKTHNLQQYGFKYENFDDYLKANPAPGRGGQPDMIQSLTDYRQEMTTKIDNLKKIVQQKEQVYEFMQEVEGDLGKLVPKADEKKRKLTDMYDKLRAQLGTVQYPRSSAQSLAQVQTRKQFTSEVQDLKKYVETVDAELHNMNLELVGINANIQQYNDKARRLEVDRQTYLETRDRMQKSVKRVLASSLVVGKYRRHIEDLSNVGADINQMQQVEVDRISQAVGMNVRDLQRLFNDASQFTASVQQYLTQRTYPESVKNFVNEFVTRDNTWGTHLNYQLEKIKKLSTIAEGNGPLKDMASVLCNYIKDITVQKANIVASILQYNAPSLEVFSADAYNRVSQKNEQDVQQLKTAYTQLLTAEIKAQESYDNVIRGHRMILYNTSQHQAPQIIDATRRMFDDRSQTAVVEKYKHVLLQLRELHQRLNNNSFDFTFSQQTWQSLTNNMNELLSQIENVSTSQNFNRMHASIRSASQSFIDQLVRNNNGANARLVLDNESAIVDAQALISQLFYSQFGALLRSPLNTVANSQQLENQTKTIVDVLSTANLIPGGQDRTRMEANIRDYWKQIRQVAGDRIVGEVSSLIGHNVRPLFDNLDEQLFEVLVGGRQQLSANNLKMIGEAYQQPNANLENLFANGAQIQSEVQLIIPQVPEIRERLMEQNNREPFQVVVQQMPVNQQQQQQQDDDNRIDSDFVFADVQQEEEEEKRPGDFAAIARRRQEEDRKRRSDIIQIDTRSEEVKRMEERQQMAPPPPPQQQPRQRRDVKSQSLSRFFDTMDTTSEEFTQNIRRDPARVQNRIQSLTRGQSIFQGASSLRNITRATSIYETPHQNIDLRSMTDEIRDMTRETVPHMLKQVQNTKERLHEEQLRTDYEMREDELSSQQDKQVVDNRVLEIVNNVKNFTLRKMSNKERYFTSYDRVEFNERRDMKQEEYFDFVVDSIVNFDRIVAQYLVKPYGALKRGELVSRDDLLTVDALRLYTQEIFENGIQQILMMQMLPEQSKPLWYRSKEPEINEFIRMISYGEGAGTTLRILKYVEKFAQEVRLQNNEIVNQNIAVIDDVLEQLDQRDRYMESAGSINDRVDKMQESIMNSIMGTMLRSGLDGFFKNDSDAKKQLYQQSKKAAQTTIPRFIPQHYGQNASGVGGFGSRVGQQQAEEARNAPNEEGGFQKRKMTVAFDNSPAAGKKEENEEHREEANDENGKGRLSSKAMKAAELALTGADLEFLKHIFYDKGMKKIRYRDSYSAAPRDLTREETLRYMRIMIKLVVAIYCMAIKKLSKEEIAKTEADLKKKFKPDSNSSQVKIFTAVNNLAKKIKKDVDPQGGDDDNNQ